MKHIQKLLFSSIAFSSDGRQLFCCVDFIIVPTSEDSAEKEEGGELPKKPHSGTCAGEASGDGIYL